MVIHVALIKLTVAVICLVLQVQSLLSLLSIIERINGFLNMESLFALLFIIGYRSTRWTVCSQHNSTI